MKHMMTLGVFCTAAALCAADMTEYDLKKNEEWKKAIEAYKPDYSDSTKYLEPPAEGRMKEPFAVVKNGKPAAVIVYADYEPETVLIAAQELQEAIEKITGVKINVTCAWGADKKKDGLNKIILGKASYSESEALKKLSNTDGFAIRRDDNKLYVYGFNSKGVMNGVFTLLENNTDIIWARPHKEIGTVYTTKKDLDFVWGDNIVDRPASRSRGWNGYQDLVWMARNRCNVFNGGGGGDITWANKKKGQYGVFRQRYLFGHNIGHFVYYKQYFKDHPEYYSLVNGVRTPWAQLCFTNEEMKKVFIENALDKIRHAPDGTYILTIDMDDTWSACGCEKCTAPIHLPDGTTVTKEDPVFRSTQYFMFLNDVIKKINVEFPDWKIKTIAYFSTATPPKCDVDAHIIPEFAAYVRSNDKAPIFAPENIVWLNRLRGWAEKSKDIDVYNYHGLGLAFPRPLAEVYAWDFREYNKYTNGMSSEYRDRGDRDGKGGTADIWDYSAMEFWVLTRLYWNPEQDVEQLRKYYIRRTFREAAPAMEKFYGTIRAEWYKNKRASTLGDNPIELTKIIMLEPGHEEALRAALDEAAAAVKHPVSAELVKRVRARFDADVETAKSIRTPEISIPLLRPEGELGFDNPVWKQAALIEKFEKAYQKQPTPAEFRSEVRLFHDSDNLCFLMTFFDDKIADVTRRVPPAGKEKDFIPEADHVELFLSDPLNEGIYYMFTADPFGTTAELQQYDTKWNGEWDCRVRRLDDRWEVLAKIPLKTINANNAQGNHLKGLILRERYAHGADKQREYSSWGGGAHHRTTQFGTINLMR